MYRHYSCPRTMRTFPHPILRRLLMGDHMYAKPATFVVIAVSFVEMFFVVKTNAWTIWSFSAILLAIVLLLAAHAFKENVKGLSNFASVMSCAVVIAAVLWSAFMITQETDHSSAQRGGNYGSTTATIAPPTPTPYTFVPGPDVVWSTATPTPTVTEEPAPTSEPPTTTVAPKRTAAPAPKTTRQPPPVQEQPPANPPSDQGSAFGSAGQGGDEPSSGISGQDHQDQISQPPG